MREFGWLRWVYVLLTCSLLYWTRIRESVLCNFLSLPLLVTKWRDCVYFCFLLFLYVPQTLPRTYFFRRFDENLTVTERSGCFWVLRLMPSWNWDPKKVSDSLPLSLGFRTENVRENKIVEGSSPRFVSGTLPPHPRDQTDTLGLTWFVRKEYPTLGSS